MFSLRFVALASVALGGGTLPSALGQDTAPQDQDTAPLMHRAVLDPHGKYVMSWTPGPDDVTIEVQVQTRGYIGLGFSPTGGMKGADIVLGWVGEDGQVHLTDRYGVGDQTPIVDDSQDVTLIRGSHNGTHTTLRFKRPWDTCDEKHDMVITTDTVRVIYAYHDDTPSPGAQGALPHHTGRGTRSLYLQDKQEAIPDPTGDEEFWDLLAPNVSLPSNSSTLYWCTMFKMPPLTRKHHFIRYKPVIAKESLSYIHHMLLFECHFENTHDQLEQFVGHDGAECYSPNMPSPWWRCISPLVGWGVGSEGVSLPPHVGAPLGEDWGGGTYFMMELHYDNPGMVAGVHDSSGLRVIYTPNVRQYDSGTIALGHLVEASLVVPPRTKDWVTVGHCPKDCTQEALPSGGIHVFQGFLHSHLLGRAITVHHIRDGRELPPIIEDKHYDFNYQEGRTLPEERTVLPGDHLMISCRYDSSGRLRTTFGGLSTSEEMCMAYLNYYPRTALSECASAPDLPLLLGAMGAEEISGGGTIRYMNASDQSGAGQQPDTTKKISYWKNFYVFKITKPQSMSGNSMWSVLRDPSFWNNSERATAIQRVLTKGRFIISCKNTGRVHVEGVPHYGLVPEYEPYSPPVKQCLDGDTAEADQRVDTVSVATVAPLSTLVVVAGIIFQTMLPLLLSFGGYTLMKLLQR